MIYSNQKGNTEMCMSVKYPKSRTFLYRNSNKLQDIVEEKIAITIAR